MAVTSESVSSQPADSENRSAKPTFVSKLGAILRLVLAVLATVTFLPYAWGFTLVVYSRWDHIDGRYLLQLVAGMAVVTLLNFHLAAKFRSKRFGAWTMGAVVAIWAVIAAIMLSQHNGVILPDWLVFAGFFPATLWVIWASWMFFMPIRWSVRLGVLAVLLLAVLPYLYFFQVTDLEGDASVNFALRGAGKAASVVTSSAGELSGSGIKLIANPKIDFPAFQGPDRSAVLTQVKLDRNWSEHPPREMWRVPVGAGWGGFAVVGGYAFTQEQRGEDECVVCRELATGREAWVHKDKAPYKAQSRYDGMGGPGPRCTPTIADGKVYTVGVTGILNCLDGGNGRAIWSKNIVEENGGSVAFHGVCGSPLVIKDKVIVCPTGRADASLAAYDRLTGKLLWAKGQYNASYATPMLASVAGVDQILNFAEDGVTAQDPNNGAVLWNHAFTNSEKVVCSQPIAQVGAPDQVLLTAGYGGGSILLKVSRGSDGTWSAAPAWPAPSRNMKTKFTTAVFYDGYVYGLDDGIMQCIDPKTGEQKWKRGRYGHGQVLLAADLLIVQTEQGPVVLIEANPAKLVELGRIPALSSKTWNCPALAGKHLLVRNTTEAACYEVSLR